MRAFRESTPNRRTLFATSCQALAVMATVVLAGGLLGACASSPEVTTAALSVNTNTKPEAPPTRITEIDPNDLITLSMSVDQSVIADDDRDSVVMIEFEATGLLVGHRPPVALAVVMDASGSMEGHKMADAIEAAAGLIEQLNLGDRITVVSFGNTATIHLAEFVVGGDMELAFEALGQIEAFGNTCTSCGLEAAYNILAYTPDKFMRRVILLSDGHANRGQVTEAELERLAANALDAWRVSTATIGLGRLHNEQAMAAMAAAGTADYYFLANSSRLAQILERELQDLQRTVLDQTTIRLAPGDGVVLVSTSNSSGYRIGEEMIFQLGQVAAGEQRQFLVELQTPEGDVGRVARATVEFSDLRGRQYSVFTDARVTRSDDVSDVEASIDAHVLEEWALISSVPIVEQAMAAYEQGNWQVAYDLLDTTIQDMETWADQTDSELLLDEAQNVRELYETLQVNQPEPQSDDVVGNLTMRRARNEEQLRGVPAPQAFHQPQDYVGDLD